MPEGDTVWLAARRLDDALAGRVLRRTDFRVPSLATVDLAGLEVREVVSRGKHLLTRVGDDLTLHTHFRMDGTWHLYRHGDRWHGGQQWQVRVLLVNDEWQAVGYRLPVVELLPRDREHDAAALRAAMLAPTLLTALRDRYDEDWFRNPRSAEPIRAACSRGLGLALETWTTEIGPTRPVLSTPPARV